MPELDPQSSDPEMGDPPSAPDGVRAAGEAPEAPSSEENEAAPRSAPASQQTSTDPDAKSYRPSYLFLVIVTAVNLGLDLWSKDWAKTRFERGDVQRVVVIEDFLQFIYAKNRGGAWGLLQNETEALRRPFFLVVSVAAIVFIVSLYRKLQPGQRALMWGLPLVLGGALGNLVDRIRYAFVVDFIDVFTANPTLVSLIGSVTGDGGREKHWPTFNVADIAICVGVLLMAIDMFSTRKATDAAKKEGEAEKQVKAPAEPALDAARAETAASAERARDATDDGAQKSAAADTP
jgi:signal peptidase II